MLQFFVCDSMILILIRPKIIKKKNKVIFSLKSALRKRLSKACVSIRNMLAYGIGYLFECVSLRNALA